MMAPSEFMAKAQARGFVFSLKPDGSLGVKPPAPGAMTDTVRAYVRKAKPLLVPLLEARHGTGEPLVEPSAESLPDMEALGLHGVMAHYATQCGQDYNAEHPEALLPTPPPVSAGRAVFAAWTARQMEGQKLREIYPEVWHEIGELLE